MIYHIVQIVMVRLLITYTNDDAAGILLVGGRAHSIVKNKK